MTKTEVIVIGVAHQWHGESKICSYEHIFNLIEDYNPDVIGVEIRQEDICMDDKYLLENYPYEMVEIKNKFKETAKIYGIDWLGHDAINKPLTKEYWKNCNVKIMEYNIETLDEFKLIRNVLDPLHKKINELIEQGNIFDINNKTLADLYEVYNIQKRELLKGTDCEEYGEFSFQRDRYIGKNIVDVIRENNGKKILIIVGLSHRNFCIKKIKRKFKDEVIIYDDIKEYFK